MPVGNGRVTLSKMLMPLYSLTARSGVMLHHRTAVATGCNVDWFSSHGFRDQSEPDHQSQACTELLTKKRDPRHMHGSSPTRKHSSRNEGQSLGHSLQAAQHIPKVSRYRLDSRNSRPGLPERSHIYNDQHMWVRLKTNPCRG